jgi:lysozyme
MPQINIAGLRILEGSEGLVLFAYDDKVYPTVPFKYGMTLKGTLTIGYGHTGADVHPGQTITQTDAVKLLSLDLQRFEIAVNNMVVRSITPNQFSALVDFAYNEGSSALAGSTLLRKLNSGDIMGASDQFLVWDMAFGEHNAGLQARRKAERELFLTP